MPTGGEIFQGTSTSGLVQVKFRKNANTVVTNTNAETSLLDAGLGSLVFNPGDWVQGLIVRWRIRGAVSTDVAGPTFQINVKIGTLISTTGPRTLAANLAAEPLDVFWEGQMRTPGAAAGLPWTQTLGVWGSGGITTFRATNAAQVINTTIPQTADVTIIFGTASPANTCTGITAELEIITP